LQRRPSIESCSESLLDVSVIYEIMVGPRRKPIG
jgi:hypothetical protein